MTSDLDKRVQQHQEGMTYDGYTHSRRPLKLVWHVMYNDPNDAIRLEKQIKGWSRAKKQALINGDWDMLQLLSECRNATHYKYNPDN